MKKHENEKKSSSFRLHPSSFQFTPDQILFALVLGAVILGITLFRICFPL